MATQAAKEGIANFKCRRLSTTASCVLRNTSRGLGDPAVARACVCRNTSERNITVMCTPQLWNTSRLKLTLHPNGPRGTTAIMTANRTKRIRRSCGCRCDFDGDGFSARFFDYHKSFACASGSIPEQALYAIMCCRSTQTTHVEQSAGFYPELSRRHNILVKSWGHSRWATVELDV